MDSGAFGATDLLDLTAKLVDVASVSYHEAHLSGLIESELRDVAHLEVTRIGDNIVARTLQGRPRRLILAGHTDTVPANGNETARVVGDVLWGLGSADMKGGLAVMLDLALSVASPAMDVTYAFYAREEVAAADNGLLEVAGVRPDLLEADVALLGEPTAAAVEAGCQGTMRLRVNMVGKRAHTARPFMGRNAIHRLGEVLRLAADYAGRRPVVEGCEYREALQAVSVSGGVAGNVVPDAASVTLNHRFAPDRTPEQAQKHVTSYLQSALGDGDTIELLDAAPAAAPGLGDPLLETLIKRSGAPVRAKLGWTDAAFFAARGVPASNFGPGDPLVAHTAEEHVTHKDLKQVHKALKQLLTNHT